MRKIEIPNWLANGYFDIRESVFALAYHNPTGDAFLKEIHEQLELDEMTAGAYMGRANAARRMIAYAASTGKIGVMGRRANDIEPIPIPPNKWTSLVINPMAIYEEDDKRGKYGAHLKKEGKVIIEDYWTDLQICSKEIRDLHDQIHWILTGYGVDRNHIMVPQGLSKLNLQEACFLLMFSDTSGGEYWDIVKRETSPSFQKTGTIEQFMLGDPSPHLDRTDLILEDFSIKLAEVKHWIHESAYQGNITVRAKKDGHGKLEPIDSDEWLDLRIDDLAVIEDADARNNYGACLIAPVTSDQIKQYTHLSFDTHQILKLHNDRYLDLSARSIPTTTEDEDSVKLISDTSRGKRKPRKRNPENDALYRNNINTVLKRAEAIWSNKSEAPSFRKMADRLSIELEGKVPLGLDAIEAILKGTYSVSKRLGIAGFHK